MNNLQAPLQNLDYENAVLATLMSVDNSYIHVNEILNEDDFSFERNRLIFRAVKALVNKSFPVDCSTVHDQLEQTKTLHSAGGDEYLTFVLSSSFIGLCKTYQRAITATPHSLSAIWRSFCHQRRR